MASNSKKVKLFIDGEFVESQATQYIPVTNPATQEVIAEVPCATQAEVEQAIASAKAAFKTGAKCQYQKRARVMMRYQALLKEHHDEIAEILALETGKTFDDAKR